MTPAQIETAARNAYNSIGDTFYGSDEIMQLIYFACMELVDAGLVIERTFTADTVISQREYDYPSQAIGIRRITYNGDKLDPIDFSEDDTITLDDAETTNTGTPKYYSIWNEIIYLRPVPDAVQEMKVFAYVEPQEITNLSTLEVPTKFHPGIVDFVLKEMVLKDGNFRSYDKYEARWQNNLVGVKKWTAKKKRTDGNAVVKNEELMNTRIVGRV